MRIIQMFHYKFKEIIALLPKIKEQGFDYIQTSPCSGTKEDTREWKDFWIQYQPINLKIGNSQVGTKDELIELCDKANEYGIGIIVDVVFRHVASDNYNYMKPHESVDDILLPFILDRPRLINDSNRYDIVHNNTGMPMLDYENEEYQRIVIKYLEDLLSCGVSKFRLDQYKHYSLPNEFNEGSFVKNVMCRYCKDMWIGEVLFEEDKQLFNEFTKYAYVHSMNGLDNNDRIVRAVENHDTYLNNDGIGYTRRLNDETIITEYGYLCGYAKHTMFYCRPFNNSWMDTRIKEANMR